MGGAPDGPHCLVIFLVLWGQSLGVTDSHRPAFRGRWGGVCSVLLQRCSGQGPHVLAQARLHLDVCLGPSPAGSRVL